MDKSAVEAIIKAHLPAYIEALGLQAWDIEIAYGRPDPDDPTCYADCSRNIRYDTARITIDPTLHDDETDVLDTLRHELFHIVLSPFDHLWQYLNASLDDDSTEARQARDIWSFAVERGVIYLKAMWRGLEAYHRRQDSATPAVNGVPVRTSPRIGIDR